MLPRTQLIRIQRSLYDRLRSQAKGLYGGMNNALKDYYTEYQKDFIRFKGFSTKAQLLDNLRDASVILCGDYHTLAQSQKTVVRLLREVNRPAVLALEMLKVKDDALTQKFLFGRMTETEFLRATRFKSEWGFQWSSYRALFDYAREHRVPVFGLSPENSLSLEGRDKFAAERMAELSAQYPEHLLMGLMGDLHMAQSHLPGKLQANFKKAQLKRKIVTVHQNHDAYYWELVSLGMEEFIEVVEIADDCYCVLNTPPWVKLQSHLKWLENDCDVDFTDEFHEIAGFIYRFLGVQGEIAENFEVHRYSRGMALSQFQFSKVYTPTESELLQTYAKTFRGLFLPKRNLIFLADLSLNQLSTQASIYVHSQMSGFQRIFQDPKEDFYRFLWVEALGFLGSKVINLRRKCSGPSDLKRQAEKGPHSSVAAAILQHLTWEGNGLSQHLRTGKLPFLRATDQVSHVLFSYRVAKGLGQILGSALYRGLIEHRVRHEEVAELFTDKLHSPIKCRAQYLDWAHRLDSTGLREISSSDRL